MTRVACRQAFEALREAGYPPNSSLIFKLAVSALSAAGETTAQPARIGFIGIYTVTHNVAQDVEGEATTASGGWDAHRHLFERIGGLIATLSGPHDSNDAIDRLGHITDLWLALRSRRPK